MLDCQRDHFDLPPDVAYLNCAYMGPNPRAALAAGQEALARKSHPWQITPEDFFSWPRRVKSKFAELLNGNDPDRVAIVPSVSYGVAAAVRNLQPRPGQNVVLLEEQFPSHVYSWRRLATEANLELRTVSPPDSLEKRAEKWNEKLLASIDADTLAVAVPQVHWADGTRFDLPALRQRSRQVGAALVVDGTQSVGALPFDVAAIQPDALVCCGYKWLLGPYSVGLAYYGERFDDGTPLEESWMNRLHSENFQDLVKYQPAYRPAAHRYNVGQNSQFVAMAMLDVSLDLLLQWGAENIQSYCEKIARPSLERLRHAGVWLEEDHARGHHLFGLRLPAGTDFAELKKRAQAANIYVSFRGNAVRVSPSVYNRADEMERLATLIEEVVRGGA